MSSSPYPSSEGPLSPANNEETTADDPRSAASPAAPSDDSASCTGSTDTWTVLHMPGSTVAGATFNFTNSIVGAGAIGLGGAIAASGGIVSIVCIVFFAVLTKLSLDMLIELSVVSTSTVAGANGSQSNSGSGGGSSKGHSYEDLGRVAYGTAGKMTVLASKTLYSLGCLVAYIIVVKDNFGSGLRHLIYRDDHHHHDGAAASVSWFEMLLEQEDLLTFLLSTGIILPLCLMRDITKLSNYSIVSVFAMVAIVIIVVLLYALNPGGEVRMGGGTTYENWFEVRPGLLER